MLELIERNLADVVEHGVLHVVPEEVLRAITHRIAEAVAHDLNSNGRVTFASYDYVFWLGYLYYKMHGDLPREV